MVNKEDFITSSPFVLGQALGLAHTAVIRWDGNPEAMHMSTFKALAQQLELNYHELEGWLYSRSEYQKNLRAQKKRLKTIAQTISHQG